MLGGKYLAGEGYVEALISPIDVAQMALFLASDEAGSMMGQDINVSAEAVMVGVFVSIASMRTRNQSAQIRAQ